MTPTCIARAALLGGGFGPAGTTRHGAFAQSADHGWDDPALAATRAMRGRPQRREPRS